MNEKQPIPLRLLGAWVGSYLSAPPLLRIYAGAGRPPAVLLRSSKRVTAPVSAVCTYYLTYDIELFEGWDGARVCVLVAPPPLPTLIQKRCMPGRFGSLWGREPAKLVPNY